MTRIYRLCLLIAATVAWLCSSAAPIKVPHDTITVYKSWAAIIYGEPDNVLVDPYIEEFSPFDIYVEMGNDRVNNMLYHDVLALAIGDTTWLANTAWLQRNFNGECDKMDDWVPLFFTPQIAFLQWKGATFLNPEPEMADYALYIIDFERKRVDKLDHKKMSQLLERYPDLQRRYESMKNYKKRDVIEYYFREYLQRLGDDPSVPWICDY